MPVVSEGSQEMCLLFPSYLDLLCWILLKGIPTNSSTQQMDHVDFLDRYHHAPLNLNFASDCQLKGSQREEGLRATPSLVVLCFFLLRTQILSKHHHLFFPFAKGHSKTERNISVFQGNTLQDEPLCPSITAVSLSSIYHSRHCNVPQQSQLTSLHKQCLLPKEKLLS